MGSEAGAIIGHHPLDIYTMPLEEAQGVEEESEAGGALFIGQDFRISQPGMIIDGEMQVFPALSSLFSGARIALANPIARDAMANALDTPQFLDINMDHLARRTLLVAGDEWFRIKA